MSAWHTYTVVEQVDGINFSIWAIHSWFVYNKIWSNKLTVRAACQDERWVLPSFHPTLRDYESFTVESYTKNNSLFEKPFAIDPCAANSWKLVDKILKPSTDLTEDGQTIHQTTIIKSVRCQNITTLGNDGLNPKRVI